MLLNSNKDGILASRYSLEHIDIEVNHRCNLQCKHCSARAGDGYPVKELTIDEIKNILSNAQKLGLRKVGLTGGEPLFDTRKLGPIVRFCIEELKVPLHTHLNGTLVTRELCEKGNVLSSFESLSVTFLGTDAKAHDNMTQTEGSFAKALAGTKIIAGAGLPLTCYYIPTHGNCEGFLSLAKQLYEIGVRKIRPMTLAPSGRARPIYGDTVPLEDEIALFRRDLIRARDSFGFIVEAGYCTRLNLSGLSILHGHAECMSGRNRVHIDSKGDVFPCTAASGVEELKLGSLREVDLNITEIWNNSTLVNRIRLMHEGRLNACKECHIKPKCGVDCMVNICGAMTGHVRDTCPLMNGSLAE